MTPLELIAEAMRQEDAHIRGATCIEWEHLTAVDRARWLALASRALDVVLAQIDGLYGERR